MQTLSSSKTQSWLTWFFRGILILGFAALITRLFDLQIIKGAYYKNLAEGNRIRRVSITAPRGRILARGGEVMVGNLDMEKRLVFDPEKGYEITDDISDANSDEIIIEPKRDYKLGSNLGHVSGYLGEVNIDELGKINAQCPEKGARKLGALVGRSGIEQQYECLLSGYDGEELVEVDSQGSKIRTLGKKESVSGQDLKTTIDYELQKKVVEIFKNQESIISGRSGAVVVSDVKGEILALYSHPSYDPNIFISADDADKINSILADNDLPLFNRVIGGTYHPGSVYKPVVAIAALEEKVIDKDFIYNDTGQITVESLYGKFTYSNWYFTQYGGREGEIDLVRAIKRSTDTFFYKTGEMLEVEKLGEWSGKFGLSKKTGIDLPGEVAGFVPSPSWKLDTKGERWFLGNTYHMSIGQGYIALTPLALNSAISSIANGGNLCEPKVVQVEQVVKVVQEKCKDLGINTESIDLVKEGMIEACRSGGTGFTFFDFAEKTGIDVACKTGTAETDDVDESTHAWFVVFAPANEPEIVMTVLVEKGGEGSKVAGPIAREIFDYWFNNESLTQ